MMTAEQMIAAQKANMETLFGLTEKAFAGVEKMVELNVQELMALQAGYLQPLSEKAAAFSRHVYEIASTTSKEFGEAVEAQAAEAQHSVFGLVDSVSKNAPAGSESAVAMMKSAMTASQTAIESVQKAVKQATEAAEANMQALATSNVATATAKTTSRKR